jgi:hypothetical protein
MWCDAPHVAAASTNGARKGAINDFALRVWVRRGPSPSAAPTPVPSAVPSAAPSSLPTAVPTTAAPTTKARGLPAARSRLAFRLNGSVVDVAVANQRVTAVGSLNVTCVRVRARAARD